MNWKRITKAILREIKQFSPKNQWYTKDQPVPISKENRKLLIREGFLASDYLIFDFEKYGFDAFLNQRDYRKLHPVNGSLSQLIDNKGFLPIIFKDRPELLPDFFAFVSYGKIKFFTGLQGDSLDSRAFLKKALDTYQKLIIKPTTDGGGRNILALNHSNFEEGLKKIEKGEYVINNFLENEEFLSAVYPNSLNTCRIVFFKTQSGKNKILMIAQRFGNSQSNAVDNVSSGGMAASVNLQTGTLSKGYSYFSDKYKGWYSFHMETGAQVEGLQIPDWEVRFHKIQAIVDQFDYIDLAGLDIAFTKTGIKVIEINSLPDPKLMQVGGPVLLDPEFRDFIVSKGYHPKKSKQSLALLQK